MSTPIFPRSPRETMAGWVYLPRFIDKIRLHATSKLAADYQANFTKGFDGRWLAAAGLTAEQFLPLVRSTVSDGEVCDWVRTHVKTPASERESFNRFILQHGTEEDPELRARLQMRKESSGLGHRHDIRTFVDYIDADELRSQS